MFWRSWRIDLESVDRLAKVRRLEICQRHVSMLEGRLTFISQAPVFDAVRLLPASVLAPQVRPVGVAFPIAVLQPRQSFFERTGAH